MTPDIKQYLSKFSKNLNCSKRTRLKLLDGLKDELSIYQDLNYSELCEKMGNPEHLAFQMMEDVDQNEIIKANRKRFLPFILIILVLLICVISLSLYYIHNNSWLWKPISLAWWEEQPFLTLSFYIPLYGS